MPGAATARSGWPSPLKSDGIATVEAYAGPTSKLKKARTETTAIAATTTRFIATPTRQLPREADSIHFELAQQGSGKGRTVVRSAGLIGLRSWATYEPPRSNADSRSTHRQRMRLPTDHLPCRGVRAARAPHVHHDWPHGRHFMHARARPQALQSPAMALASRSQRESSGSHRGAGGKIRRTRAPATPPTAAPAPTL